MARIVSKILQLDELAPPPPVVPPAEAAAPATTSPNVPVLIGGLALSALAFYLWMPLGVVAVVCLAAWLVMAPAVQPEPTSGKRRSNRLAMLRGAREFALEEVERIGLEGEIATVWRLARLPNDYVILHNLIVPAAKGTTQIDLALVGPEGVWCLEVKAWTGRVYGQEREPSWTQVKLYGNQMIKERRENPVLQNEYHCAVLRSHLGKMGVAAVRSLVVFTRAELKTQTTTPVVLAAWLPALLDGEEAERVLSDEEVTQVAEELATLTADAPLAEAAAGVSATQRPGWVGPVRLAAVRLAVALGVGAVCAFLVLLVPPVTNGLIGALAGSLGAPAGVAKSHLSSAQFLPVAAVFGLAGALKVLVPERRRR